MQSSWIVPGGAVYRLVLPSDAVSWSPEALFCATRAASVGSAMSVYHRVVQYSGPCGDVTSELTVCRLLTDRNHGRPPGDVHPGAPGRQPGESSTDG